MMTAANVQTLFAASQLHLGVLEEFIGTVEAKLTGPMDAFSRDSLLELLGSLREKRASYRILIRDRAADSVALVA